MASRTTGTRNGFWLKVVGGLLIAAVMAASGVLWGHHGEIERHAESIQGTERRLGVIEADIKELLRRVPER